MDVQFIESKLARRPHSPLFARLAGNYLASGEIEKALELCSSGIERYPQYNTAYLIRAKCFAAKQEYVSALINLKQVANAFPDSTQLQKLEQEWKDLAVRQEIARTTSSIPSLPEIPASQRVETESIPVSQPVPAVEVKTPDTVESIVTPEPVQQIAHPEIPESKPSIAVEQKSPPEVRATAQVSAPAKAVMEGERIVSKTLAEIYAKQGEYEEAIITYRILQQQRPKQSEEFAVRIKELEVKKEANQN